MRVVFVKKVYPDGVCSARCERDVLVVLGVKENSADPWRKGPKSGPTTVSAGRNIISRETERSAVGKINRKKTATA